MEHEQNIEKKRTALRDRIREKTNVSVADCYQCGKCTAGCPLVEEMDMAPNQVLRMLQYGFDSLDDKVMRSYSIWLCLTCQMCYSRCPKSVDLPAVMDYVRTESMEADKVNPRAKDIVAFHRTFLDSIRMTGRLYEMGLVGGYKMRTRQIEFAASFYRRQG